MVKKLLKHEMNSYLKIVLPIYIVLMVLAAFTRFLYIFDTDHPLFRVIGGSTIAVLVTACFIALVLVGIFAIVRFYKNLFTNEGYLSFTLPITCAQHIFVKLLAAFSFFMLTVGAIFMAFCVATFGEVTVEVLKAAFYIFEKLAVESSGHAVLYAFEMLVLALFRIINGFLLIYACIAIGQLSNKFRIGVSVAVYFVYYFINQAFSSMYSLAIIMFGYTDVMRTIIDFVSDHFYFTSHSLFFVSFVWDLIIFAVYFFVTYIIMKKRLNLE